MKALEIIKLSEAKGKTKRSLLPATAGAALGGFIGLPVGAVVGGGGAANKLGQEAVRGASDEVLQKLSKKVARRSGVGALLGLAGGAGLGAYGLHELYKA